MIADYNKFQKKIDGLLPPDKKLFLAYLQQETDLSQIAEESGIAYESAKQKIVLFGLTRNIFVRIVRNKAKNFGKKSAQIDFLL